MSAWIVQTRPGGSRVSSHGRLKERRENRRPHPLARAATFRIGIPSGQHKAPGLRSYLATWKDDWRSALIGTRSGDLAPVPRRYARYYVGGLF